MDLDWNARRLRCEGQLKKARYPAVTGVSDIQHGGEETHLELEGEDIHACCAALATPVTTSSTKGRPTGKLIGPTTTNRPALLPWKNPFSGKDSAPYALRDQFVHCSTGGQIRSALTYIGTTSAFRPMQPRLSRSTSKDMDRILEQMERAFDGDAWHGPSVREALRGVRSHYASERLIAGAHTIWEIVLHLEGWKKEVTRRLEGAPAGIPEKGDWPEVVDTSDSAWQGARQRLAAAHAKLLDAVQKFSTNRLDDIVRDERPLRERLSVAELPTDDGDPFQVSHRNPALGTGLSFFIMLNGCVQHDVYHTGQIAVLKKRIR